MSFELKLGQELEVLLEKIFKDNETGIVRVGSINIGFSYSDSTYFEYLRQLYAPFPIELVERGSISEANRVETIYDPNMLLRRRAIELLELSEDIFQLPYFFREFENGSIFVYKDVFMNITLKNGDRRVLYNIGNYPKFGLSSSLRKFMMDSYYDLFPELLIFHAAGITEQSSRDATIFASSGTSQEGMNAGKTTITLANTIRQPSPYAIFANDDVVLGLDNNGRWINLPLPAELNIRRGTLESITAEGLTLPLDDYLHADQHDTVYSATMGHLEQGGYSVANGYERIKNWIFVSLQVEKIDYDAQRLNYDRGLDLFIDSIRQRRMHQLKSDPSLAEMVPNGQLDDITPVILERAKRLYDYLISQKVTFWIISGGVDREKLFNLTNSLSEQ